MRPAPASSSYTRLPIYSHKQRDLTPREKQIVTVLVANCYTVKETAAALNLSESTVNVHLSNVYGKTDSHSLLELARWAHLQGLVRWPSPPLPLSQPEPSVPTVPVGAVKELSRRNDFGV